MKKLFFFISALFFTNIAFSQSNITIKFSDGKFDSIKIISFAPHQTKQVLQSPFSQSVTLQSNESLKPGMYNVLGDSTSLGVILIPNEKNQKFSITILNNEIVNTTSKETNLYYDYLKGIKKFNHQLDSLNKLFENARTGGLPQYMLRVFVDSLSANARSINNNMRNYQIATATANENTLFGAIVATSSYLQDPSQEILNNRNLFQKYYIEHFFDNFTWNDPRIFNTVVVEQKIKEYCNMIYQFDNPIYDTLLVNTLNKSKQNETSYQYLFDAFERVLGKNISPYKVEHTYIAMLKDALSYPKLDEDRKRRYTRELSYIDKNHAGDLIPNFNILLSNGDTTTMYNIQSDYILLYLQHPTCPTCHQVRNKMKDFSLLNKAINSGKLKVVMIYFEDDEQVWNNYIHSTEANPRYLQGWNFDQSIDDNNLFDTRTIPYMFLLDKDKKVIKKDLLINEIEPYIENLKIY